MLEADGLSATHVQGRKPRVLLLADCRGWYFDIVGQALIRQLSDEFDFKIDYAHERPDLKQWPFDLVYVFFWGETYHQPFVSGPRQVIKEIASHRWELEEQYGKMSAPQMVKTYLADAGIVTTISKRLQHTFEPYREVWRVPQGFDPGQFQMKSKRTGPIKIGWAGNVKDPCKGVQDILQPAASGDFELHLATGSLTHQQMADFYNSIDVICVASTAEGGPMPLIEAMACGCFPIAVDVGIVPELVTHQQNGLIVERTPWAFRDAFAWCTANPEQVREAGAMNAQQMLGQRTWTQSSRYMRTALRRALQNVL